MCCDSSTLDSQRHRCVHVHVPHVVTRLILLLLMSACAHPHMCSTSSHAVSMPYKRVCMLWALFCKHLSVRCSEACLPHSVHTNSITPPSPVADRALTQSTCQSQRARVRTRSPTSAQARLPTCRVRKMAKMHDCHLQTYFQIFAVLH